MDELSEENKLTVARARKIQRFLSQPFQWLRCSLVILASSCLCLRPSRASRLSWLFVLTSVYVKNWFFLLSEFRSTFRSFLKLISKSSWSVKLNNSLLGFDQRRLP